MQKYISYILIIGLSFFISGKAFSQSTQTENETKITNIKNEKLFNEGGYVKGITTARAIGLVELSLGILSIVFAIRAKKRYAIKGARTALTLGVIAAIFSIVHLITVAGAIFGSGSGKAGAILALLFSLGGITIGALVLLRQKKV